jgi:DNA helicase-2/ATP-dependent DNA helicase PcrA
VVDEYQDVNPLQGASSCGGERQSGGRDRHHHPLSRRAGQILTGLPAPHFVEDHPTRPGLPLTPQVVGCANDHDFGRGARPAVTLEAQRPAGPEVEFAETPDEAADARAVADWLVRQAGAGVGYREKAVLFRINAQSPAVEQALAERNIPYLVRGGERFYERPEVRQALLSLRTEARVAVGGGDGVSGVDHVKAVLGCTG